ncbi:protein BPS1, chloroplastic-like [Cornus florida]|uniref:protein BPS1, chloroplastic-like n=1 Tax=Cornus florida TaxID=4283 RepID=UPI0028A0A36D|nr:protein BPS1, chloroplastic-like [Cornus florida]
MSRPQDLHRPSFSFGNPFRMISPKGSYLSPKLLELLNTFEDTLAKRLSKLKPKDRKEVLGLSWMRLAMESLCETHTDIKTLISNLDLPVCDWDEKWIDVYFDNSVKLLDICNAFSSELAKLNQGHLYLQCVLHKLDSSEPKQFSGARSSLDGWRQQINSKNRRLENCFAILEKLTQTLDLPKVKNSAKGKVLMRAMYGVKAVTVFICSIFAAAFSGSAKKLIDLQVSDTYLWAEAFADVQTFVNREIRSKLSSGIATAVKELEAVDASVKKLYPIIHDGANPTGVEGLRSCVSDFGKKANELSQGLDLVAKEVDGFFQIVLTGRDALLCNLRVNSKVSNSMKVKKNVEGQAVR